MDEAVVGSSDRAVESWSNGVTDSAVLIADVRRASQNQSKVARLTTPKDTAVVPVMWRREFTVEIIFVSADTELLLKRPFVMNRSAMTFMILS